MSKHPDCDTWRESELMSHWRDGWRERWSVWNRPPSGSDQRGKDALENAPRISLDCAVQYPVCVVPYKKPRHLV